jgi:hypothetical protein
VHMSLPSGRRRGQGRRARGLGADRPVQRTRPVGRLTEAARCRRLAVAVTQGGIAGDAFAGPDSPASAGPFGAGGRRVGPFPDGSGHRLTGVEVGRRETHPRHPVPATAHSCSRNGDLQRVGPGPDGPLARSLLPTIAVSGPGTELRATQGKQAAYHLGRCAMQMIDLHLMTGQDGAGQRQSAWRAV